MEMRGIFYVYFPERKGKYTDMCTAVTYRSKEFYFGRNLDYEFSFGEQVAITPRRYSFRFRNGRTLDRHYAMIGMAHVADGYPLYYDAVNEKGLGIAGLNFVGNACYFPTKADRENVASFELIPRLLGTCACLQEAKKLLAGLSLSDEAFNDELPPSPLHWLIADRDGAVTVEQTADGLHVYDNPVGVLTNNPPFPIQLFGLNHYLHLSPSPIENTFAENLDLRPYSRGMGAIGLPGDLSSASRFVRAAFVRSNLLPVEEESAAVSRFFHLLQSVEQSPGCCRLGNGQYEYTLYSACCNADRGIYYYKTYDSHRSVGIDMHSENTDGEKLILFPLRTLPPLMQNAH